MNTVAQTLVDWLKIQGVEVIFGIPGLGTLTAEAIIGLQYGALQTYVAAMAILFVVVNIGVDILYGVVDPRIRNV